jgi:hypothetical protein
MDSLSSSREPQKAYAFLLRGGDAMNAVHDLHVEGLFARATWLRLLSSAGYQAELIERPVDDGDVELMFLSPPLSRTAAQ